MIYRWKIVNVHSDVSLLEGIPKIMWLGFAEGDVDFPNG